MSEVEVFMNDPGARAQLFTKLYERAFPAIARFVSRKGGSFEEAKDIFQDALVVYYERLVSGRLSIHTNEKAYLLGVARNLWNKKLRGAIHFKNSEFPIEPAEGDKYQEASASKLLRFMEAAGGKCLELLKAFYYDSLPLTGIAELFGFSGSRSATVQKYKCLERVRDKIKEKTLSYEDFLE